MAINFIFVTYSVNNILKGISALSLWERAESCKGLILNTSCQPSPLKDDCMDAAGRATSGTVAEKVGMRGYKQLILFSSPQPSSRRGSPLPFQLVVFVILKSCVDTYA
jgi:hypothetical protein